MAIKNKEIAKLLNISPAAVSLARNNKSGVSEETRQKVNAIVMNSLRKEITAESAQTGKRGTIILAIHKRTGDVIADTPFFLSLFEAVREQTKTKSYELSIVNIDMQDNMDGYIKRCRAEGVEGILVLASEMTKEDLYSYYQVQIPVVLLDSFFPDIKFDAVGINNRDIIRESVKYAWEKGHTEIGFLQSTVYTRNFEERYLGYCQAMQEFGLKVKTEYTYYLHCTADKAYLDMKRQLEEGRKLPTVFLAGNDFLAAGAMKALKEKEIRVPEQVSLIGMDDIPLIRMMEPAVTSVRMYIDEIACMAIKRLLERIENPQLPYCKIEIGGELIERDSVRAIKEEF